MTRLAWSLVLASVVLPCGMQAQAPKRLPVIAGNGMVNVLVDLDGTVKTWGDPHGRATNPSLGDGSAPGAEVKEPRPLDR